MQILQYQFPVISTGYDANWLIVACEITHPKGAWRFKDPCLLTCEAEQLASWMEAVAGGEPLPTTCDFMEPNLEFRAMVGDQRPLLRVHFDVEARPKWAPDGHGREDIWVQFPLDELDLGLIAREWRWEISKFPQRGSLV